MLTRSICSNETKWLLTQHTVCLYILLWINEVIYKCNKISFKTFLNMFDYWAEIYVIFLKLQSVTFALSISLKNIKLQVISHIHLCVLVKKICSF